MSKLLSSKSTPSDSSSPSVATTVKSLDKSTSISSFWRVDKEKSTDPTLTEPDPIQYYQQQSNYLEGGVTITGKAPSKTERKSHRKELAVERKNLMQEVKESGDSPTNRSGKQLNEKKTGGETKGKKRKREIIARQQWCWKHLQSYFTRARIVQRKDLELTTASLQSTYGEELHQTQSVHEVQNSCQATCVFCCILNNSTNTLQSFQTVHTDITDHALPIAFYFTLYMSEGESSFIVPLAGEADASKETVDGTFSFFKTFFALPRLFKITFGLQRLLRLLDLYYQHHLHCHLLTANLCSQSCMDVQLLAWVMDSDNQGVLKERQHKATKVDRNDTPDLDSPNIQLMSLNYKAVSGIVGDDVLNPKDVWNNKNPESYLELLLRRLKQMHVWNLKRFNYRVL